MNISGIKNWVSENMGGGKADFFPKRALRVAGAAAVTAGVVAMATPRTAHAMSSDDYKIGVYETSSLAVIPGADEVTLGIQTDNNATSVLIPGKESKTLGVPIGGGQTFIPGKHIETTETTDGDHTDTDTDVYTMNLFGTRTRGGETIMVGDHFSIGIPTGQGKTVVDYHLTSQEITTPEGKTTISRDGILNPTITIDSPHGHYELHTQLGRPVSLETPEGTTSYSYDFWGRLKTIEGPEGKTEIDYQFGVPREIRTPDGITTMGSKYGLPAQFQTPFGNTDLDYNGLGGLREITGANGEKMLIKYSWGRPVEIINPEGATSIKYSWGNPVEILTPTEKTTINYSLGRPAEVTTRDRLPGDIPSEGNNPFEQLGSKFGSILIGLGIVAGVGVAAAVIWKIIKSR